MVKIDIDRSMFYTNHELVFGFQANSYTGILKITSQWVYRIKDNKFKTIAIAGKLIV